MRTLCQAPCFSIMRVQLGRVCSLVPGLVIVFCFLIHPCLSPVSCVSQASCHWFLSWFDRRLELGKKGEVRTCPLLSLLWAEEGVSGPAPSAWLFQIPAGHPSLHGLTFCWVASAVVLALAGWSWLPSFSNTITPPCVLKPRRDAGFLLLLIFGLLHHPFLAF